MSTNGKPDIEIVIGANKVKTKSQVEKDLRKILDEINKEQYFSNETRGVKVGVKSSTKTQIVTDLKEIFNNGYEAKGIVYRSKDSKSKYPVSKQIREPSRFINKAVSEFELWLKENDYNVMIDCNEIYKK